jgi:hypothetical protein
MHHLQVYHFDKKVRKGVNQDGGYVIADLGDNYNCYDCYISAGISCEESFSRDFLKDYSITDCYGFDGTIEDYPWIYTDKIKFIKKNINGFNDNFNTDLTFLTDKFNSIFLKMDIEGGEYPWILNLSQEQLSKFKQIVIEFHDINDDRLNYKPQDKKQCIEKLNENFYLVHAHGNVYGGTFNGIPNVIELTYVNKNHFKTVPKLNTTPLPIKDLDYSNNGGQDILLNFYPFTSELTHFC